MEAQPFDRLRAGGFSVHNGKPVKRNDTQGLERVAQYIIRNPFSEQKMTYNEENGTVIYRSRTRPAVAMGRQGRRRMHSKTKRNPSTSLGTLSLSKGFEVFSAEDFIAAITQHIPDKGFQMVRYYGWYSNRSRGERARQQAQAPDPDNPANLQVIDVSDYQPRRLPSKKWRELIKKVWEVDPFECPRCGSEMRMIALIDDPVVIEKILRHLDLWPEESLPARAPPERITQGYVIEPFLDDLPFYDDAIAG
jgi:hypothetical protein